MRSPLDWKIDGAGWPNREASRFVAASGLTWHVQVMGEGPVALLIHGTGSSTHSWRDVMPLLAKRFTVIAPDLPGHAFTSEPQGDGKTLVGMARGLGALLDALKLSPERAAGHSAGAAILVRMRAANLIAAETIVAFNGAYFPFGGAAASFFSPLSKFIARSPVMPKFFSAMADDKTVEKLLRDTGSTIDKPGLDIYRRLFANERHVAGTLAMMASWDLTSMEADLRRLAAKLYLVKALGDLAIEPSSQDRAARSAANAAVITLLGVGHLAHEENPALAADIVGEPQRFAGRSMAGKPL
jgi:magnesium chelatase accessory protein